ncbi:hypothetical protein KUCAC02_037293, partial [Chaenocephalus aceratus]
MPSVVSATSLSHVDLHVEIFAGADGFKTEREHLGADRPSFIPGETGCSWAAPGPSPRIRPFIHLAAASWECLREVELYIEGTEVERFVFLRLEKTVLNEGRVKVFRFHAEPNSLPRNLLGATDGKDVSGRRAATHDMTHTPSGTLNNTALTLIQ